MLNWNRRQDTLDCLAALQAMDGSVALRRLLLVDNGSEDGTVAAVRDAHPRVEVLALPDNRGYAAGMNAGIRHALAAGADWTLLVNNDAVAAPGASSGARPPAGRAGRRCGSTPRTAAPD